MVEQLLGGAGVVAVGAEASAPVMTNRSMPRSASSPQALDAARRAGRRRRSGRRSRRRAASVCVGGVAAGAGCCRSGGRPRRRPPGRRRRGRRRSSRAWPRSGRTRRPPPAIRLAGRVEVGVAADVDVGAERDRRRDRARRRRPPCGRGRAPRPTRSGSAPTASVTRSAMRAANVDHLRARRGDVERDLRLAGPVEPLQPARVPVAVDGAAGEVGLHVA